MHPFFHQSSSLPILQDSGHPLQKAPHELCPSWAGGLLLRPVRSHVLCYHAWFTCPLSHPTGCEHLRQENGLKKKETESKKEPLIPGELHPPLHHRSFLFPHCISLTGRMGGGAGWGGQGDTGSQTKDRVKEAPRPTTALHAHFPRVGKVLS